MNSFKLLLIADELKRHRLYDDVLELLHEVRDEEKKLASEREKSYVHVIPYAGMDTADKQALYIAGVDHSLINEVALLSELPGSPPCADALWSLLAEVPALRKRVKELEARLQAIHDAAVTP